MMSQDKCPYPVSAIAEMTAVDSPLASYLVCSLLHVGEQQNESYE
jgi:hypothetical protein